VHNIVATSQISSSLKTLNLHKIHGMLPFSYYDQRRFAAITVRLHQPDCTTLLFSSGKLVVTGCRSWYECVYASLYMAGLLRECIPGHTFELGACDVQNMVAHVEIPVQGGFLDLQGMYSRMALNCTYQRKMFPGLIYRPDSSPVVLLCFFSGKIVITGGKTMEDVFTGWNRLWPTLRDFIVPSVGAVPDGGVHHEGLALEGDAVARDPAGVADALVEPTRGGAGWQEPIHLLHASELQGLCDDLAAEGDPLLLGGGLACETAAETVAEPGAPHPAIIEAQIMGCGDPAKLEAAVVLLGRDR
jgi:transcription initiation factor TFIID TATA-box-binding protein